MPQVSDCETWGSVRHSESQQNKGVYDMQDKYFIRISDANNCTCESVGPFDTETDATNYAALLRVKYAKHPYWRAFTCHYLRNPKRFTEE